MTFFAYYSSKVYSGLQKYSAKDQHKVTYNCEVERNYT